MKQLLLICLLTFSAGMTATAQILPFRTYSIEKGLSEAVVNDIIQDEDGYLWIGTSYGLNRFDGIEFKNYYSKDGLLDNKIFSLYEDHQKQLWIGTGSGVNIMRTDSIYTLSKLKPLESSKIVAIYQDKEDGYWFGTDGEGIWHFDHNHNLTHYGEIHGLGDNRVQDILEDDNGVLWFATYGGLTKLEDGNFRTYTTRQGLPDNRLRDLRLDEDGSLWVASRGGLCNVSSKKIRCYTEKDGLINNRVQSISTDKSGGLWLGTEEGASFFQNGTFTNYSVDEGLANNFIYTTYFDSEGNIWFGTFGGGISLFLGNYLKNYTVEQGLPNNVVTGITEDQADNHWISTYGGGISKLEGNNFTTFTTKDGLVDNKAYTITTDRKNQLLIGTQQGFSVYNGKTFINFNKKEVPYHKIRTIFEDENTSEIWLGTNGEGILNYQNNQFKQLTEKDGLANNTVMDIEQTKDGALWFATYGGLSKYEDKKFTNYSIQEGLPNNGIQDILKDKNGNLWFSTFGGIARLRNDTFETITSEDGLPDEVCYFIEQDNRGIFWIGTNKGVIRFDYEAFTLDDGSAESRAFKVINQNQGLVSNEMNVGASFKDHDGNLWFGSAGGLTRLDPSLQKTITTAPKVHIENIQVAGEYIPVTPDIEIGSNDQNISFEFIGISFSAPEQVQYKYRLKNSGENWQQTMQRSVRYSALMAGDYTFEVKAQSNEGLWSSKTASVHFTVLAPFWMRWWFILLFLLLIAGIILFIYNYYKAMKMVDIERMRVRIASDLHDDVGSALTEIALQSDFLQTTHASDNLQDSLQQIGTQSRKIVSSLDDIVWSIDARNDTVGDLTDRMQDHVNSVLPQKEIKYHFEVDMEKKLKVALKENLYLIFKEAVNNVAKHSNAQGVDVFLKSNGDGFMMSIKDNGTDISNTRKSGQGLRNMKMRAKRIDADIIFNNDEGFEVRVENSK